MSRKMRSVGKNKKRSKKMKKTLDKQRGLWYTCKVICFTPKKQGENDV
jgi:hypothetical protein